MKKLVSILMILVMLLALAPAALAEEDAEEEIIAEEEIVEAVEEPALDGIEIMDAWISDGKMYWNECAGADYYVLHFRYEDGVNGQVVDEAHNNRFLFADMPVDIQSFFERQWNESQEITLSVTGYQKRDSGVSEMVGRSKNLAFSFDNQTTEPVPVYAWWDGTTIRWEKPDMARFGITKENEVIVYLKLFEDGREIFDSGSLQNRHLDKLGTSLDVSKYIEMPERSYRFMLWFGENRRFTEKYESESFAGQELLDGLDSRIVPIARISLTLPEAGESLEADGWVTSDNCLVHSQRWCSEQNIDTAFSGPFEANKTYYWFCILEPDDGYVFPGDKAGNLTADEFDVTVNGESVLSAYRDYPTKHIGVWYSYTVPGYGEDIALTGLQEPAAGEPILAEAVLSDGELTITEQKWRVSDGSTLVDAAGAFEAGRTYYYSCTIVPPEGTEFAVREGSRYGGEVTLNEKRLHVLSLSEILDANKRIKNGESPAFTGYSCSGGSITLHYSASAAGDPEPVDPEVVPNTYELDLSGAQVSGSEVTGTGKMVKTAGNQPVGKRYVYIVVNYERPDGSTWAVAGTYAVDSDGEFDLPSITGVSDKVSSVLVIGVDSKTGANWAGHNITKPARIKP